jgi:NMD protein affecting ribosome stability and mRNA decay
MIISCANCGKKPLHKWGLCEDCYMEYEELGHIVEQNKKPDSPKPQETK